MENPEVKICGITNFNDALSCLENGIDCIGFIFFKGSKRYVSPENTKEITKDLKDISLAGVFVDESAEFVADTAASCMLNIIQLHGKESVEYIEELGRLTESTIIKCLYLNDYPDISMMNNYTSVCKRFLIEAEKEILPGGNGISWDYSKTTSLREKEKIILAGGINPDNFEEAVLKSRCEAFDMSSGVEISPGVKDSKKIELIGKLKKRILIDKRCGRIFI